MFLCVQCAGRLERGRAMKFVIFSLGCKVNQFEAQTTARAMEERGWSRNVEQEPVDAVLIFTWCVTNTAAAKSRKALY